GDPVRRLWLRGHGVEDNIARQRHMASQDAVDSPVLIVRHQLVLKTPVARASAPALDLARPAVLVAFLLYMHQPVRFGFPGRRARDLASVLILVMGHDHRAPTARETDPGQ